MTIKIYTDGACSSNPGIGGWGVVILIDNDNPVFLNGGMKNTTNNQMELQATIQALKYFDKPKSLTLYTDSKYVKDGIQTWIIKWKQNGWKTSAKKPVKNKILWIQLDSLICKHEINWKWIRGHSGNENNEKADFLARSYIEKINENIY